MEWRRRVRKREYNYFNKRMCKGFGISLLYRLCGVLPICTNKIVFTTFEGNGGYCCNPRYIAKEIIDRNKNYKLVWLVNDTSKKFPDEINVVSNTFWNRLYHLTTAKVWVDNTRKPLGTLKRRNQIYIQTWHGSLEFKAVGRYRGKAFPKIAELISLKDSRQIDYMISNSKWHTNVIPKMMLYSGEIIETGTPRCDILVNNRKSTYRTIREHYELPRDSKIVLYAPTFRGGSQQGSRSIYSEIPTIDFNKLLETLQGKFGGKWYLLLRMHPQLAAVMEEMPLESKPSNMVDVSKADDMNELIAGCDVFLTDYSSAAFDASYIKLPVFLYADDLEEYIRERGEFMWNMKELPFPLAESNEELMEKIEEYDEVKYREVLTKFLEEHKVVEDGKASKRVVDVIEGNINSGIIWKKNPLMDC